jgi:hypothetical protein
MRNNELLFFILLFFMIIPIHYQISNNAMSNQLAPSIIPVAHAVNANLFVSAENSQFNNYMSGPQVIEVVIIDSDINDTDEAKGEPDVTINGKTLRMAQAVDGNWYGYFADRDMAQIADQTVVDAGAAGAGLDFGTFCSNASTLGVVDFTDTVGVAIPGTGGTQGTAPITTSCASVTSPNIMNVLRENKEEVAPAGAVQRGQIGLGATNQWPLIQLYTLNPTGNVVIQYNKGGGVQTTTLTFDNVDQFAKSSLDKAKYTQGAQVHVTVTDLWLNIDPTDEDSWTFGTNAKALSANYQVFDENGGLAGANVVNGIIDIIPAQSSLMVEDNGVLILNVDKQNSGQNVLTLQDNDDSQLTCTVPQNVATCSTSTDSLDTLPAGTQPITVTEQGPNSGIFGSYDESDKSVIKVTDLAKRGTSASIDYNKTPRTVQVGFDFATVNIAPTDAEWTSGEEIPVIVVDGDANKNSRTDEDLDLNNPNVTSIPSLRTGTPITLSGLTVATLDGDNTTFTIDKFSDRALLTTGSPAIISDGDDLTLTFGTMADVFDSTPINQANFHGFTLFNYDVRALQNTGNLEGITSVDITLSSGLVFADQPLQGLILLPLSFGAVSPGTVLTANFNINIGATDAIPQGTTLPIVADVFGFGFTNDGIKNNERFANQIIRLELEETGDNTSTFDGTLEYIMINQLNILDPTTYTDLVTISNESSFVVIDDLDDEESPRVNYNDKGADGVTTQVSDQEAAQAHSGIVSIVKDEFNLVVVELVDLDLNVDSDQIDIYTSVTDNADANFDVVGDKTVANGGTSIALSTGKQLGILLDVTFDDQKWTTTNAACLAQLTMNGITQTGLGSTGFTLVETGAETGIFGGDFQIPDLWCKADSTIPESVIGLDVEAHYIDFRDVSGEIIDSSYGDGKKFELQLDSGSFTPIKGFHVEDIIGNKTASETDNFFFLQTTHYLDLNERKKLEEQGITLVDFLNGFVYVASANDTSLRDFEFVLYPEFHSVIRIEPETKRDSNMNSDDVPPWIFNVKGSDLTGIEDKVAVTVFFHGKISASKMTQIIADYDGAVGSTIEGISAVSALMSFGQITKLSEHSTVKFIRYQDPLLEPEISKARKAAHVTDNDGNSLTGSLTGKGVVALIFDETLIFEHIDLKDRIFNIQDIVTRSPHSVHVAGILGGSGAKTLENKGVAPNVEILSWDSTSSPSSEATWTSDAGDLAIALTQANTKLNDLDIGDRIDLMNISMGQLVNNNKWDCKNLGNYTETSQVLDSFVTGHLGMPKIIITKSAGNERDNELTDCTLPRNYQNQREFGTVNSPATAKNPIVVGSIDTDFEPNKGYVISKFSSWGPTDDGRIKPDLVAPGSHNSMLDDSGCQLISVDDPNCGGIVSTGHDEYYQMSGTSMAAPFVGGLVALMEERFEQKISNENISTFESQLLPYTAKAILIHTADDLGNPGPDYKYGWGLVNGKNAINLIAKSKLVNATKTSVDITDSSTIIYDSISDIGESKNYLLKIGEPTDLKLTLVWDDPPVSAGNYKAKNLENDLDLWITNSSKITRPFVLGKDPDISAGTGTDSNNNVEMIKTLQNKELTITVKGSKGPFMEGQDFTLIVSTDTRTTEIPSWIKNNAGWWVDGSIDDNSFVQGIQYLIKKGIMKIPPTEQGLGGNEIPSWIKDIAGWWADGISKDQEFIDAIQTLIRIGTIQIES